MLTSPHPLRLNPGDDLRASLTAVLAPLGVDAAFVLQGIGSLSVARLRLAGAAQATELRGDPVVRRPLRTSEAPGVRTQGGPSG